MQNDEPKRDLCTGSVSLCLLTVVTKESLLHDMHRCPGKLVSQLKICEWVEGL